MSHNAALPVLDSSRSRGGDCGACINFLLCVFLPPLGVYAQYHRCDRDLLINVLLTIIFWIPGALHALWVCGFFG